MNSPVTVPPRVALTTSTRRGSVGTNTTSLAGRGVSVAACACAWDSRADVSWACADVTAARSDATSFAAPASARSASAWASAPCAWTTAAWLHGCLLGRGRAPRLLVGQRLPGDRHGGVQPDDHRPRRPGRRARPARAARPRGRPGPTGHPRVPRSPRPAAPRRRRGARTRPSGTARGRRPRWPSRTCRWPGRRASMPSEAERGLELADVRAGDPGPQGPVGGQVARQHDDGADRRSRGRRTPHRSRRPPAGTCPVTTAGPPRSPVSTRRATGSSYPTSPRMTSSLAMTRLSTGTVMGPAVGGAASAAALPGDTMNWLSSSPAARQTTATTAITTIVRRPPVTWVLTTCPPAPPSRPSRRARPCGRR